MAPPIFDAYYEDDLGAEVELMGIPGDTVEDAREIAYGMIRRRLGEDQADAWKLDGQKLRSAFMDSGGRIG